MKRICSYIFIIVCLLAMGGCSVKDYSKITAYDRVEKARENYAALDSGRLTIIDNSTGNITQDFIFKYEGDTLTYSYIVVDENETYYEYHNGSEINYTTDKSEAWTAISAGNEKYYVKTKTDKHPLTDRTAISINPDSIVSGQAADHEDGGFEVTYSYDIEKLASYATALESVGKLTDFHTRLDINAEGYCTALTQTGTFLNDFGEEVSVDYTMTVTEMNSVEKITRPIALWEAAAE